MLTADVTRSDQSGADDSRAEWSGRVYC